jgi:hypothetical protein
MVEALGIEPQAEPLSRIVTRYGRDRLETLRDAIRDVDTLIPLRTAENPRTW